MDWTGVGVGKSYGGVERKVSIESDSGGWMDENALLLLLSFDVDEALLLDRFRLCLLFLGAVVVFGATTLSTTSAASPTDEGCPSALS